MNPAHGENVSYVEGGGSFLRARIPWILWQGLQDHAGASDRASKDGTGVVDRFGVGVADLQPEPGPRRVLGQGHLQCVIGGVRIAGDQGDVAGASDPIAGVIEFREGSECRIGASVTVGRKDVGKVYSRGPDISGAGFEIPEIVIDTERPAGDGAVTKVPRDSGESGNCTSWPGVIAATSS